MNSKAIIEQIKLYATEPRKTLYKDEKGETHLKNLAPGQPRGDLSRFTPSEIRMLEDHDGWNLITADEVYKLLIGTGHMHQPQPTMMGPGGPMLYPQLGGVMMPPPPPPPPTAAPMVAIKPPPPPPITINKFQVTSMGRLLGDKEESLVFFYPSHTMIDKTKMTALVLNFGAPVVGDYKIQLVNALNPSAQPKNIHGFGGGKSMVLIITVSETFNSQTSVYIKMTPVPVDAKGNQPPISMQMMLENMA